MICLSLAGRALGTVAADMESYGQRCSSLTSATRRPPLALPGPAPRAGQGSIPRRDIRQPLLPLALLVVPLEQLGHGGMRQAGVSRHGHLRQHGLQSLPDVLHRLGEHWCRGTGPRISFCDWSAGGIGRVAPRPGRRCWRGQSAVVAAPAAARVSRPPSCSSSPAGGGGRHVHLPAGLRQRHVRDAEAFGRGSHRLQPGEIMEFLADHTLLRRVLAGWGVRGVSG